MSQAQGDDFWPCDANAVIKHRGLSPFRVERRVEARGQLIGGVRKGLVQHQRHLWPVLNIACSQL